MFDVNVVSTYLLVRIFKNIRLINHTHGDDLEWNFKFHVNNIKKANVVLKFLFKIS